MALAAEEVARSDVDGNVDDYLPAAAVRLDPLDRERPRLGMIEQLGECGRDVGERCAIARRDDALIPLDPLLQRRRTQVGAPNERRSLLTVLRDDVGLGMETLIAALEDAELRTLEVHQSQERIRLRHAQIIASDHPHSAAAGEDVAQVRLEKTHPAVERERDGDVHGRRAIEVRDEVRQQRIVRSSAHERSLVRRPADPEWCVG